MTRETVGRPWVADKAERRRAGSWQWWTFAPGSDVRCPVCSSVLAQSGLGLRVAVRLHPSQQRPAPTERLGASRKCGGCRFYLDLAFMVIDPVPGVA